MTISSLTRTAGPYYGNGVTVLFPFAFKVFSGADLRVTNVLLSTMVQTTLALVTDYNVSLNANQDSNPGGSISLTAGALPLGYKLTLTSAMANLQPTEFLNQGGFYPEVLTDALDRLTILIQQLQVTIINSFMVQPCLATVVGTVYTAPAPVVAAFINGALLPPTAFTLDTTGTVITLTFTAEPLDVINALCTSN